MTLHLIGDSIVQSYKTEQFIAGWGQYLPYYLSQDTAVINHAIGGRSSRSFINEGRFEKAFEQVKAGDYVLIEFCHNDDASKPYNTMVNRLVGLGEPDEDGRYPIIPGERVDVSYIPEEFIQALKADESAKETAEETVANTFLMLSEYPGEGYYPYSADAGMGSFKWFVKQYVDEARERGAVPVLVTAPARGMLDEQGKLVDGAGLHGGDDFCYIRAVKQLAQEMKVPVIDLFEYSRGLYEDLGAEKVHYLMSVKCGCNEGVWPADYEAEVAKPSTVMENTHFNKYGACLLAREMARQIADSREGQLAGLKACVKADELDVVKEVPPKMLDGAV